ncbi:hypothetical protein MiSe_84760 [Microseira wollei NIES-4236]|uniref:Transposase n=1 Tax=Microseira wollei NIES-4236 TaxID=2530354 RepID=A0AAV3XQ20_9CYAN|nr:hypothetical protein MiSe_84760 [Microseira wollei NIES-4236]
MMMETDRVGQQRSTMTSIYYLLTDDSPIDYFHINPKVPQELETHIIKNRFKIFARFKAKVSGIWSKFRRIGKNQVAPQKTVAKN